VASSDSEPRLAGRIAVITGGGSGIGLASARRLAAEGARVVIADLDPATGTVAAAEVDGEFVAVDVSDPEQVERLFSIAVERFGRVDVSFHNAGISPPDDDSILTTGLDAWRRVQDVNLTSVYLCCRAVLPIMQRQGQGSIINTASFVALLGAATPQLAYTASKGGVLALTRELAVIHAREKIRVNALCPGPLRTELLMKFLDTEAKKQRRLVHIPMGRFGEAKEMAQAALFLASDESSYMTGATFTVDGGITAAYVTPE
jgi:NAD(P)-dependent dehydrogenase (short-subunit alcohol dehydrogenase family)